MTIIDLPWFVDFPVSSVMKIANQTIRSVANTACSNHPSIHPTCVNSKTMRSRVLLSNDTRRSPHGEPNKPRFEPSPSQAICSETPRRPEPAAVLELTYPSPPSTHRRKRVTHCHEQQPSLEMVKQRHNQKTRDTRQLILATPSTSTPRSSKGSRNASRSFIGVVIDVRVTRRKKCSCRRIVAGEGVER